MAEEVSWSSKSPVGISHRRAMIDLSIADDPKIKQLNLVDKQFNISQTLIRLEKKFPKDELYFIFGSDVFMKMNTKQWPGLDNLFNHYIVVFERGVYTEVEINEHAKSLGIAVAILPSMYPQHSSTDVRLKPHEKSVWVPKKVADYIDKNRLYSSEL